MGVKLGPFQPRNWKPDLVSSGRAIGKRQRQPPARKPEALAPDPADQSRGRRQPRKTFNCEGDLNID